MSPSERPTTTDRITIPAITANNPRPVFFYHKDRNLGAFLLVPDADSLIGDESDAADEVTIRLQPCGTVKARLLDRDGKPMAGLPVSITPVGLQDASQRFVVGHTDQQGHFEASRVIPSTDFQFIMNSSPGGATIDQSVHLKPGEVLDLGDVQLDTKAPDRPAPSGFTSLEGSSKREPNEVDQSQLATGTGDSDDGETPPATNSKEERLPANVDRTYAGKVLGPTGQPLAGVRLSGIGENRRVQLSLSGPTIAKKQTIVVTRKMKNIVAFVDGIRNRSYTHHGASPTIVASPTQPIIGRVVDSKTKAPLAGLSVRLARLGTSDWLGKSSTITDTTDADGRFRLRGAPLGGHHVVEVEPSLDAPYFTTKRELPVASGSDPLECDFELPRVKWISGRVTDESGIPVAAILEFYPFRDNPHAETYTNFEQRITGSTPDELFHTDEDGQFRVKAIPGPAVLAAVVKDHAQRPKYVLNCDAQLFERIGGERMGKLFNSWSAEYFDAMIEVNVSDSDTIAKQNHVVKLGGKRLVKIADEANKPLSEIHSLGRTFPPRFQRKELMQNSTLEVIGLKPNETRTVVLLQRDRKVTSRSAKVVSKQLVVVLLIRQGETQLSQQRPKHLVNHPAAT